MKNIKIIVNIEKHLQNNDFIKKKTKSLIQNNKYIKINKNKYEQL